MHACDVHFCVGGKRKEEKLLLNGTWYQRGWLKVFFYDLISFLVFWFFTVALLAWRVVFFFFLFLVGIGLGWVGVHYTTWGESLPSTGLQVHVTFFLIIDEMAGGGMERGGWLV